MPLTDRSILALKTTGKIHKHFDGGGLHIHVAPTGGKLWRLAYRFNDKAKLLSFGPHPAVTLKMARDRRDEAKSLLARGMGFVGKMTKKPLTLALDRTNWESRRNDANILVLSVCLGDVGLPIFWIDLRMAGNSDTPCRLGLVQQFVELFGVDRIHVLIGDREFIGHDWFAGLIEEGVPFVMRLRENIRLSSKRGKKQKAIHFFHGLRPGEFRQLDKRRGCGVEMTVCGLRSTGELLILSCHGIEGSAAAQAYMHRWNIETGFEKLTSHGFHMESSRLRGDGKMELLLAALAIAMAWSYSCGDWSAKHVVPIKLKKHGRPEHSVFARGLMLLGDLLHGFAKNLRRVSLVVSNFLRAAIAALEK